MRTTVVAELNQKIIDIETVLLQKKSMRWRPTSRALNDKREQEPLDYN